MLGRIWQLGSTSLFCSFSSAETKWLHLLRVLGQLLDHKDYNDDKCRLILSDPVICVRHFDCQSNIFLEQSLRSDMALLTKIKDWFFRVEYQQRGSPHIHMLIWLEGAPVFGVDQTITGQKPIRGLINQQIPRHSHSSRKRPKPPMRTNCILCAL